MNPAALEKAYSLARIAKEQGAPLSEFVLTLTTPEAYELLDYIAAGGLGRYQNHDLLIADVEQAKKAKDPFGFLHAAEIRLEGLLIWPVSALH